MKQKPNKKEQPLLQNWMSTKMKCKQIPFLSDQWEAFIEICLFFFCICIERILLSYAPCNTFYSMCCLVQPTPFEMFVKQTSIITLFNTMRIREGGATRWLNSIWAVFSSGCAYVWHTHKTTIFILLHIS